MFEKKIILCNRNEVIHSAKLGANITNHNVPLVEGSILKYECDFAFWCAFTPLRKEDYFKKMIQDGNLDYIKDRATRFTCSDDHMAHEEL